MIRITPRIASFFIVAVELFERPRGVHLIEHGLLLIGIDQMFLRGGIAGIVIDGLLRVRNVRVNLSEAGFIGPAQIGITLRELAHQHLIVDRRWRCYITSQRGGGDECFLICGNAGMIIYQKNGQNQNGGCCERCS